eukprot:6207707-Pleurochrysis_carterae.AAC.1
MRVALERAGAGQVTFAQCALGAPTRKHTTVAHSRGLREGMRPLGLAQCAYGWSGHPSIAHGRDERGEARAA